MNHPKWPRCWRPNHYGLPKAKERIPRVPAVRKLAAGCPKMHSPVYASWATRAPARPRWGGRFAEALVASLSVCRWAVSTTRPKFGVTGAPYIGALPGRIIQTMRTAGMINPLFMLDEKTRSALTFEVILRRRPWRCWTRGAEPSFSDHYLEVLTTYPRFCLSLRQHARSDRRRCATGWK